MRRIILTAIASAIAFSPLAAQTPTTIATATARYEKRDGFVPVYLNDRTGQILLEFPRDSTRAGMLDWGQRVVNSPTCGRRAKQSLL